jgi:rRNA maturation endonuclease Nob1
MVTAIEVRCLACGRLHWRKPIDQAQACPSCGGLLALTGRFHNPALARQSTSKDKQEPLRAINPSEVCRVHIP